MLGALRWIRSSKTMPTDRAFVPPKGRAWGAVAIALASVMLSVGSASSQEETAASEAPWLGTGIEARRHALLDTDGDGWVSADEFAEDRMRRFAGWDADGDGEIDLAAYLAGQSILADRPAPGGPVRWALNFKRLDGDNDGRLTREEYAALGAAAFSRLDGDADGRLSVEELRGIRP